MKIVVALASVAFTAGLSVAAVATYEPDLLDVKFKEGTKVRLRGDVPADLGDSAAVGSDLRGIAAAFARGSWTRTHGADEEVLDRLRTDGQPNSAKPLPDLNNYLRLRLPPGLTAAHAKQILERYASVEAAYFVPKPLQAPLPPNYSAPPASPYQDYLDAAPFGIDARNAWSRGWNGAGVKVCDVEYFINRNHADLPPITIAGDFPIDVLQDDHGTSVMGILASKDNGWGTKGIAFGSAPYASGAYTSAGYDIPRAIIECGAALSRGDVVLIEQQIGGPFLDLPYPVPAEWSKPVYDTIVTLVANGIVVVETAGNGGRDLDDPIFSTGNDGHYPFLAENDSGAILVTGGTSPYTGFPRTFWEWTTTGTTVDLQGWGDSIVTTGNGNLYGNEGPDLFYRSDFGGSSGAAAMAAGAAAILEQAHNSLYGTPAPPALVKHVLVSTGTPQAPPVIAHMGPLPNVKAALDAIGQVYYVDDFALGGNRSGTSWANAFVQLQDALQVATPGARILVAEGSQYPDWNPATQSYTSDRTASFQLKNGVTILGGFPHGGGTRDTAAHVTSLKGDLGVQGQTFDNSYHIVTAGSGIDDTAVLDGVRITLGNANGAYPYDRGPALYLSGASPVLRDLSVQSNIGGVGGGIYNENGSPSFQKLTVAFNQASSSGGGMDNEGGGPRITDGYFLQNGANGDGGGLFTHGGSPHIERTSFVGNQGTRGGGIANWPGGSLVVDASEFRNNSATIAGGGVYDGQGLLRLGNVTMNGNSSPSGGGVYLTSANSVTIRNSILWGDSGGEVIGSAASVSNSLVAGGYAGPGNLGSDPLFKSPGTNLKLKPASPAINAGDPGTCAGTDLYGFVRVGACDMGAYEYLGTPGTYWSNGEVDLVHAALSLNSDGDLLQSADDFVVPNGMVCEVSSIRGVLQDGSKAADAVAFVYADAAGVPYSPALLESTDVHAYCDGSPSVACSDASDCGPGGTCVLPGQSLGSRAGFRLWEPRFDVDWRFAPGKYWVSIFGTYEPDSPGGVYQISAGGLDPIRESPYMYKEPGVPWTDGGVHDGDISRNLALDIDAVCLPDADGDLSPAGEDCDDNDPNRSPQSPEVCDGIDNNCDGVADIGAAPWESPKLTFNSRSQIAWTSATSADSYDIARGELDMLRSTGGDFSTGACDADHVIGNTYDIPNQAPHGLGLWYLVRPRNSICGTGLFDDGSASEVGGRDAELAASSGACP